MNKRPNKRLLLSVLALLPAALLAACRSAPMAADMQRLQGHWQGRGPGGDCTVTVAGDSLHFWARPDFWYQTTFTLPAGTDPLQLHATIVKDSTQRPRDIGKVVVALVKFEGDDLTLGVVNDFESPPESPVGADWDRVMDLYHLTRARPPAEEPSAEEGG